MVAPFVRRFGEVNLSRICLALTAGTAILTFAVADAATDVDGAEVGGGEADGAVVGGDEEAGAVVVVGGGGEADGVADTEVEPSRSGEAEGKAVVIAGVAVEEASLIDDAAAGVFITDAFNSAVNVVGGDVSGEDFGGGTAAAAGVVVTAVELSEGGLATANAAGGPLFHACFGLRGGEGVFLPACSSSVISAHERSDLRGFGLVTFFAGDLAFAPVPTAVEAVVDLPIVGFDNVTGLRVAATPTDAPVEEEAAADGVVLGILPDARRAACGLGGVVGEVKIGRSSPLPNRGGEEGVDRCCGAVDGRSDDFSDCEPDGGDVPVVTSDDDNPARCGVSSAKVTDAAAVDVVVDDTVAAEVVEAESDSSIATVVECWGCDAFCGGVRVRSADLMDNNEVGSPIDCVRAFARATLFVVAVDVVECRGGLLRRRLIPVADSSLSLPSSVTVTALSNRVKRNAASSSASRITLHSSILRLSRHAR